MYSSKWTRNLLPAVISSIIITITCIASASLMFSGPLSEFLPIGISCALIGAVIVNIINGFYGVFPFAVSSITPNASVVMAVFLGHIASHELSKQELFYTIFTAFLLTNFFVAIVIFLWGKLKLARLIRYMPYPVLNGFYAGVGGYLIIGSFAVLTGKPITLSLLNQTHELIALIPMLSFVVICYTIQTRFKNSMLFFYAIIMAFGIFYSLLWLSDTSLSTASQQGLLLNNFQREFLFNYLIPITDIRHARIDIILQYWVYIPIIIIVNLLSLLAYAVNFEEVSRIDININRESEYVGEANMIASLLTGATTIYTTQSIMHKAIGATHHISVIYVGVLCACILVFNDQIIPYVPKFIFAGIIFLNGLMLIRKWLLKMWRKMNREEWMIVSIIFLVMIGLGILQGVAIGVILTCMLFIRNSSQIDIIQYGLSGEDHISHAAYPVKKIKTLQLFGAEIYIIKLTGFIFFGSAENLLQNIRDLFKQHRRIKYLILDFSSVADIDTTATITITKLQRLVETQHAKLILTAVSTRIFKHLGLVIKAEQQNLVKHLRCTELVSTSGTIYVFDDLDYGLEWCEREMLKKIEFDPSNDTPNPRNLFNEFLKNDFEVDVFHRFLSKQLYATGDYLQQVGDPPNRLFFIIDGHVVIKAIRNHQERILHEFGAGVILGEIALFSDLDSAPVSIQCRVDTEVYVLTHDNLEQLKTDHPDIAAQFLTWLLNIVTDRLQHANHEIELLTKY